MRPKEALTIQEVGGSVQALIIAGTSAHIQLLSRYSTHERCIVIVTGRAPAGSDTSKNLEALATRQAARMCSRGRGHMGIILMPASARVTTCDQPVVAMMAVDLATMRTNRMRRGHATR